MSCGSPPHAWGRCYDVGIDLLHVLRFTPTCVGQMFMRSAMKYGYHGSPPHAWGRCTTRRQNAGRMSRFTPTCVGQITGPNNEINSLSRFTPTCVGQIRLEHQFRPFRLYGSPPHAWGRWYALLVVPSAILRFTPTCVGQMNPRGVFSELYVRFTPTCVGQIPDCAYQA